MKAPQIIMIVVFGLDILYSLIKDGEPQRNHNTLITVLSTGIIVGILIWGGFFN